MNEYQLYPYYNWRVWQYKATATQTDIGGGSIMMDISPGIGNAMFVYLLSVGADDYAAGRTCSVRIYDNEATKNIISLLASAVLDNQYLRVPQSNSQATTAQNEIDTSGGFWVYGTDNLRILYSALAQNETATVIIRAFVKGNKPSVSVSDSTGTVADPTEAYNVVV